MAGALVAVGVVLAIVALTLGGDDPTSGEPSGAAGASALLPGSLAKIDPETGDASVPIPRLTSLERDADVPPNLAIGEGGVWMYGVPGGGLPTLEQFDEGTGEMQLRRVFQFDLSNDVSGLADLGLAVGSRTVWFSGADERARVSRINPATHEELDPVSIGSGVVTDLVLGGEWLWVGSSDGTLTTFDPLTGRRSDEIEIDGTPDALAFGNRSVWALDQLEGEVLRVDPIDGGEIARIPVPGNARQIAAGDGGVWGP